MNKSSFLTIAAISPLLLTQVGWAGIQWFPGDHDAWFEAVGGETNVTTINFTELPNATTVTDQYANLGVMFAGLNFTTGPFNNYHDQWGINIFNGNHLYFDQPINWIAADFIGTLRFELYDGDELFHTTPIFGAPPHEGFGGLISDRPFDHVRIFDPSDFLAVVDDLHFGPPIVVPVPAAFAPFALALVVRGRRKRA